MPDSFTVGKLSVVTASLLSTQEKTSMDELFELAYVDPYIGGNWLKSWLLDHNKLAVVVDTSSNECVGFFIPRKENGYWRSGTVFVHPDYRGQRIMQRVLTSFFETHTPAIAWVANANHSSKSLYLSLGFQRWRDHVVHSNDGTYKPGAWYQKGFQEPELPPHQKW